MNLKQKMNTVFRLITDKNFRFDFFWHKGMYNSLPDEQFLKKLFFAKLGRQLDLKNPKTFNEKLQWLKLHDFKPEYTAMADKYAAKGFVSQRVGEEYVIPNYGVWDRFEDIDFEKLPDKFVMKCTHDSGGLVICHDKSKLDLDAARKKIQGSLSRNWFYHGREYPYKDIPPRIIAEKLMTDHSNGDQNLTDYKFFCFDGKPCYVMTVRDRSLGVQKSLHRWYDMQWNLQDLDLDGRHEVKTPEPMPEQFPQMCHIAETLSAGIKHLRVDLYLVEGSIYFGEMTFYHKSGLEVFDPAEWDKILGDLICIPGDHKKGVE